MKIDILSDPVCPWCYIGYTRLEKALAQRPDFLIEIEWHPFMLNPQMPEDGMERTTYLETKFGGKEGAYKAYLPIAQTAATEGLDIEFDRINRTPSTINAHRLLHWAQIEGAQTKVAKALFDAYFHQGGDISDIDILSDVADSAGLNAAVIRKLLASDAEAQIVREKHQAFEKMGITSVPTFIVAGQHAVPGAVETELWLKVIDEVDSKK